MFRVLSGGPGTTSFQDGPGSFDGRLPDGSVPGGAGWQTDEQGDGPDVAYRACVASSRKV